MKPRGTTVTVRYVDDPARTNKWGVFWNVYREGFTGRPKQKAKFYATEAEARAVQQQVLQALEANTPLPVKDAAPHHAADSFAALAGDDPDKQHLTGWLKEVRAQREANTLRNYRDCVRGYLAPPPGHPRYPGLGDLIISDATCHPKVFADYLEDLYLAGVSLSMRRRLKTALSAFCTYAKFAGKLKGENPCFSLGRKIRHKGEEDQEAAPNPFTGDEVTRLFDQLDAVEEEVWAVYCQFLLDVGVRPGEAAALKWTAINLDKRYAEIELAYSTADGLDKLPKTHERRRVALSQRVTDRLLKFKVTQAEQAFKRFGQKAPVYTFTTTRGARCLQGSTVQDVLARTLEACEIDGGHTLYNFRDTFATGHLIGNWDRKLTWVSKQLGHKTPRTTEKFYYAYRDTAAAASFADEIAGWK